MSDGIGWRSEAGRRIFTLVEMLVVVAVIMILAGLLLPALAKAKEKGRQTLCASNLRQMHLAETSYSGDHNDYLTFTKNTTPASYGDVCEYHSMWIYLLLPYLGQKHEWYMGYDGSKIGMANSPLLYCPSQDYGIHWGYFCFNATSYNANTYWGDDNTNKRWVKLFKEPYAKDVFFFEAQVGKPGARDGSTGKIDNPRRYNASYPSYGNPLLSNGSVGAIHGRGGNIVYGDGSVTWFHYASLSWPTYTH